MHLLRALSLAGCKPGPVGGLRPPNPADLERDTVLSNTDGGSET